MRDVEGAGRREMVRRKRQPSNDHVNGSKARRVEDETGAADIASGAEPSEIGFFSRIFKEANATYSELPPIRRHAEYSNGEMSVKEALAKGFRNYKVRLPKKQIQFDSDPAVDPNVLYSLFANDAVEENTKDVQLLDPPKNLRDALSAFCVPSQSNPTSTPLSVDGSDTGTDSLSVVKQEPADSSVTSETRALSRDGSPMISDEKPSVYPFPPFWRLPVVVTRGYRGGYYVKGVRYVQMTTLMHFDSLAVRLESPIQFDIGGEVKSFTFNDILLANGVALNDPSNCSEISKIFTTSVVLLHHSIAEHLLCNSGPSVLNPQAKMKPHSVPIPLSAEFPPLACYKLQFFALGMNRSHGPNEIFDPCKLHVSSSNDQVVSCEKGDDSSKEERHRSVSPSSSGRKSVNITLTARQKGLVITHLDTGATIDEIAEKFRVTPDVIENIILNRAEAVRDQTAALMAETDADDDRPVVIVSPRKKKVRRTTFVGLNILMWRFFKDCRDNGIMLNGKLLKDHAMMIARQLGLENFKGSEGWLDAFKRRHRIDLKMMTGIPFNYEETEEDRVDSGRDDNGHQFIFKVESSGTSSSLMDGAERVTEHAIPAPSAVANAVNMKPLDLMDITGGWENGNTGRSSYLDGRLPCVSPQPWPVHRQASPVPVLDEKGFIAAVVKSAAIRVHDKDLSLAIETIRSYILSNDPSVMPLFLELHMKLAELSREQKKRDKEEHLRGDTSTNVTHGGYA
ncbi:hypothetical protein Q1695_013802 [Nippostrongylus brasiliensis]|nr:hypothetical protein Q1695_013802 [Nippostrongylus brasiliensis]